MKICRWTAPVLIALAIICFGTPGQAADFVKLQGAGASFPAPLYLKWFKAYGGTHKNVQIDYQSVGSGSGVKSFIDRTVDFGASDAAMTPDEMAKVEGGVLCLPMTAGSIVLAYNVQGVPELRLSRRHTPASSWARSRNGTILSSSRRTPASKLPDAPINVVMRADSSGTTFVFYQASERYQPGVRQESGHQQDAQLAGGDTLQGQ